MKLEVDKQTTDDLEIFERSKGYKSIYGLFKNLFTIGGRHRLEEMLRFPMTDINYIQQRSEAIRFFQKSKLKFSIDKDSLDFIEFYLKSSGYPTSISRIRAFRKAVIYFVKPNNHYYLVKRGINYIIQLLQYFYHFINSFPLDKSPYLIQKYHQQALEIFKYEGFAEILKRKDGKKLNPFEIEKYDFIFRYHKYEHLKFLLDIIYEYDVYYNVSSVASNLGFSYPKYREETKKFLHIKGLFHPFIDNPVGNDIYFSKSENVYFITGPNMSGKSTLAKAVGVSVYLAHVGFPVPASYMSLTLFKGLVATINLHDNLTKGYSHFYNEVLRIKYVAEKINELGSFMVIFDEVFKGTNVKDAYDASLAIIKSFSKISDSFFIISSHITEVADSLKDVDTVVFNYLGSDIENGKPQYNFKLNKGISHERLGMVILKQEKILEILQNCIK